MARSRLPLAAVSGRAAEFSPTDEEWKRLEQAYGHKFSGAIRQRICEATTNFLRFEPFERAAEPRSLARKQVLAFQQAAKAVHEAWFTVPATTATVYAHHLIKRHLTNDPIWRRMLHGRNRDDFVRRLPALLLDAGLSALADLDDPRGPGYRKGECWDEWVRKLTYIAKEHRLPTSARTDTDKKKASTKSSPFVLLVRELQQLVPAAAARHGHSDDALAKAIQRARPRRGASANSPTAIPDLSAMSDESLFRYAMRK
jgi:hypothetical protein